MAPFLAGCALTAIPHGSHLLVADERSWYNIASEFIISFPPSGMSSINEEAQYGYRSYRARYSGHNMFTV